MTQKFAQQAIKKRDRINLSTIYQLPKCVALEHDRNMFLIPLSLWVKPKTSKLTYSFQKTHSDIHELNLYNSKSHNKVALLY